MHDTIFTFTQGRDLIHFHLQYIKTSFSQLKPFPRSQKSWIKKYIKIIKRETVTFPHLNWVKWTVALLALHRY